MREPHIPSEVSRDQHDAPAVLRQGEILPEMATTRKVSGWVWGNIVFGGLIGLAVDAITGGLYNVNPDQVSGTLVKRTSALDRGPDVMVVVVLHPDPKWVRIGTLERW
jgi:hypothetical protein